MSSRVGTALVGIALVILTTAGCRRFEHRVYASAYKDVREAARKHQADEDYGPAVLLASAMLDANPDDKEARVMINEAIEASPDLSSVFDKKLLGSNMGDRTLNKDFPIAGQILLYPFNRILDFVDLITIEAGPCVGAGLKFQFTDSVALGAQTGFGETMFGLNRRHLSARASVDEFAELFPLEARGFSEGRLYTGGVYAVNYAHAGAKEPTHAIYMKARDFWAVGAHAQALAASVNFEIHPVEFWDLGAGFLFLDPLRDDIGISKRIKLTSEERSSLRTLADQVKLRSSEKEDGKAGKNKPDDAEAP